MATPGLGAEAPRVARAFQERVLACGVEPVNRLEVAVETKLAEIRSMEEAPAADFAAVQDHLLEAVLASRPYRAVLRTSLDAAVIRGILREARTGHLGPADLPGVAERLSAGPQEVRIDLAAELLHAAAPDRIALLSRWVWNPTRRTGILAEFGGAPPETYLGTQGRLAEIRLELEALGFRGTSFASVDVLLALTYAGRLSEAVDRSFQGGGIERLLPGAYPLATIVLGVRRRLKHADR